MMNPRQNGFTLVEIMIAMGVLVVIASIALPAYTGYMTTARMTDGKNELYKIRLAEEEFFLENNRYFGPVGVDGTGANIQAASNNIYVPTAKGYENFQYQIDPGACGDMNNCYQITATPKAGSPIASEPPIIISGP